MANEGPHAPPASTGGNNVDDSGRRSSQASTLATWASSVSGHLSLDRLSSWCGVSIEVQVQGGKKVWLVKASRLGRWIILFHLLLAAAGAFNVATSIFTWTAAQAADRAQQRTLESILDIGSQLAGMEQKFHQWVEQAAFEKSVQREGLQEEERLWNALIKMFETCATHPGSGNSTDVCAEGRQYFQDNPLPRMDKSPLAKRSLAKIDVIIRRDHLHLRAGESGSSAWVGRNLLHSLATASFLCICTLAVLSIFLALRWLVPKLRNKLQHISTRKYLRRRNSKSAAIGVDDNKESATMVYSSGGDFWQPQASVIFRGHKVPDAHSLAMKGAWLELAKLTPSRLKVDQVDTANEYGSLLTAAARSGNLQTVNFVLSCGARVDVLGGRYHNVLQTAAHSGSTAIVDRLLQAGATDASIGGFYGTCIQAAAERGDCSMLSRLLTSGNITNSVNELGGVFGTPLIAAAARGSQDSVSTLIEHAADVSKPNAEGTTALHLAAASGHSEIVSILHRNGCTLNGISTVHGTPLHAACNASHSGVAEYLLESGADPSIEDHRMRTPLHAAATQGIHATMRAMLDIKPQIVDKRDADGQTALHLASIAGDLHAVKILLQYSGSCSIGDKFDAQPLFRAAGCGFAEVVSTLLNVGHADANAVDCFGRTALHGPSQTPDVRVHRSLIDAGADVNATGNDQKTPLHEACNMGRIANVELLLSRKEIAVNKLDNDQFPPLYKALCSSDAHPEYLGQCVEPGIVDILLERQDVDVNVSSGIAIQEAARKGMVNVLRNMVDQHGANVKVQGGKYGGVLQAAAIGGNLAIVNILLDPRHQVDVNQTGGEFGCPLSAAAAYGHTDVVQRLLEAGADACQRGVGRYGSPMQSVCRNVPDPGTFRWTSKSTPILELIKEYGGTEALQPVEKPHGAGWRWLITPAGWAWVPPGEM